MSGFMTFAVYALRIATDMPVQSDYMPDIASYFLSSISFNMIAFVWFIFLNRYVSRSEIPILLELFADLLNKILNLFKKCCSCCLKKDKDKVIPVDEIKKAENGQVISTTENAKVVKPKCGFCNRCEDCDADFKKDKDKGKKKKDIESKFEVLNYFFFMTMFIAMLATQLSIWINLKKA